jgi:hypothetical protein
MAEKTRQDEQLSAALSEAKAEWERERMSLEKALLAAKLKFKAERTTSANIRKRLAVLQKEVATLREGSAAKLGIVAGPQKPASPPAAAPSAPAPTPATTAAAATTAATTIAAGGPETSKTSAPPGATAPSPLLDVPDAEEAASE